ncbi:hypothetical protein ABIB57_000562 [Devosia sp. UYZn731]|uniref:SH3 domain-containing protein n=1 Tax=Devosia sp. UYZn731 TaxID=3156345 RepID=UPI003399D241
MPKRSASVTALLAAMLVLATSLPAFAASNICDFKAYADGSDPAGTNVRSGPGTDHGIIGVLKAYGEAGYEWTPGFQVTKFENGWFQIGDALVGQYGDGLEETVFKGPGWVSAKLVDFDIQDWRLRDAPSIDAQVTLEMNSGTPWSLDDVHIATVHACEGRFLEVTLANPAGQTKRGWITDLCGNQVTTCS